MVKTNLKEVLKPKNKLKKEVYENQSILKSDKPNQDILTMKELKSKEQFCTKLKENINLNNTIIQNGADGIVGGFTVAGLSLTSGMPVVQSFGTVVGATVAGACAVSTGAAVGMKVIDNKLYKKLKCDKALNEFSQKFDNNKMNKNK